MMSVVLAGLAAGPAWADQTDSRLDGLFDRLQETADVSEAAKLQNRIWQIWFESDDQHIKSLMNTGVQAMNRGRYEESLTAFDSIVEKAPEFAEGWNRRATLHYLMGNYEKSVSDVQKVLDLEPRHFGALSGLGLINMRLGYDQQAVKAFQEALKVNPHMSGASANIESLLGDSI